MVTNGFEGECSNYGRTQEDGGRMAGWMDGLANMHEKGWACVFHILCMSEEKP